MGAAAAGASCRDGYPAYNPAASFADIQAAEGAEPDFRAQNAGSGDIDSFKALCTALSATVGTGNIVGVATAIHAGGPGALFWMWMAAFFGMATKYAEGLLAVKYRETDEKGEIAGGPMYYIKNGMGEKYKWLGGLFAFFGVLVAYFGIGTFAQVNSIVDITKMTIGLDPVWTGAILTIFVAAITIGGLQSIAAAASRIVPAMAFIYFLSTIGVLLVFADKVPAAVSMIFESAFTTTAATGGFLGATVMMAMKNGVARGVFSNESGLGSAPIVAAAAKTKWPAEQGLISMTGTFIDTIIICTLTGLTLVVTGVWCGMEMVRRLQMRRLLPHSLFWRIHAANRPCPLCFYDDLRLELLRRTLHDLSCGDEGRSPVPFGFYPSHCQRRVPQAGSHLDSCGYRERPHGHSKPDCSSFPVGHLCP